MAKQPRARRTLDALPDTVDFRDRMYEPALLEVPQLMDVAAYRRIGLPVLDQKNEGACTGFALAAVANYLLAGRGRAALADPVSARMFYIMAKRYDDWPGESYSGSSARGAMKGWHKHGVCAERLWKDASGGDELDTGRSADAISRPLGAYYRVNHRDLISMHAAIAEVGILSATARVHRGWLELSSGQHDVPWRDGEIGGHAFAIVGYDREGFWIQNSWGTEWGDGGFARISYGDWLANGSDVWVAARGVSVTVDSPSATAMLVASGAAGQTSQVYARLRPHIVTARNDGVLDQKGTYGLTPEGLRSIVEEQIPRRMEGWQRRRVALYAHGGLVSEEGAVRQVIRALPHALDSQVYPLSFLWRSDALTTLGNILREAIASRRDEGVFDRAMDFLWDRIDDMLEPAARALGGKAMWDEMKENALGAGEREMGVARLTADLLAPMRRDGRIEEVHLIGHSAGAILLAPLVRYFDQLDMDIDSVTLWAPACTMRVFQHVYVPLIDSGRIRRFTLYTLDDKTEQDDDCLGIYHKSLLYLVSRAFEAGPRIPLARRGERLLGLARHVDEDLPRSFWVPGLREWKVAPESADSHASHHGDFNDDAETLRSTFEAISGRVAPVRLSLPIGAERAVRRRQTLEAVLARHQRG